MSSDLPYSIRDVLFADLPIDVFLASASQAETWRPFHEAGRALSAGHLSVARETLIAIATDTGRESQQRLQAWHFLRQSGGKPPENVKNEILGVVVESAMKGGLDLVAAYADRTARYYNHAGPAVIWLRPDSSLDNLIDSVLRAAYAILPNIGPWDGPRRPSPQSNGMRLNILTPIGLYFGEGPIDTLERDRLARPLVLAVTNLLVALTSLPKLKGESIS